MRIGIDASRAFLEKRTGIEEYSFRVIERLKDKLADQRVVLYVRGSQQSIVNSQQWSNNWEIRVIKWPFFWTQIGLSLEMLLHPVDVLFVPAHTVPLIHSKKTVVTIHGLEYEFCPEAYSFWERVYMRWSIKFSCKWASKIISVSENTKRDLMELYKVPAGKVRVIYEGYETRSVERITHNEKSRFMFHVLCSTKYLLFVGRIEERKNISNIVKAFGILKEKYAIGHKLVLAGKTGFGFDKIQSKIQTSRHNNQIILTGFISEGEKWELLKNADCFVFPTKYEGFGIPILEAQSVGCPVVASDNSSTPEVTLFHSRPDRGSKERDLLDCRFRGNDMGSCSALLIDCNNASEIAEAIWKILSDEKTKKDLVEKGLKNVKRFSWEKCAQEIAEVLKG